LHPDKPYKIYLNHRNSLIMMMKNYAAATLLWVLPGRLLLDVVAFVYRLFHGDFRRALAIVRAVIHVFVHWRSIYARRQWSQKRRRVNDGEILQRIYRRSIVWDYFILGRKFFSKLPMASVFKESKLPGASDKEHAPGVQVASGK
jgi:hypothetical protein